MKPTKPATLLHTPPLIGSVVDDDIAAAPPAASPAVPPTKPPRTRRRGGTAPPSDGDSNALRYKSGSRGTPYPRQDGERMVKVTFHATWTLDVVLASFSPTLRAREARNAWMERVIMDAIRAENGQRFIDDALKLAEQKEKKTG